MADIAASAPGRTRGIRRLLPLTVPLGLFYLLALAPLAGLVALAFPAGGWTAYALWTPATARALSETLQLLIGVGLLASLLGVGSAWLVAMYQFPGRGLFAVLLVLPVALPTYLAAYVAVELTDFFGPFQRLLRAMFGFATRRDYWFPETRSLPGAIFVLSLALYPYVYLPARLMFERQGSSIIQAARLHGSKGWRLFFRIGLPLARPAIVGGAAFVLLETLNDVGAVEHFGVQTISLAIRALWLNRGNLAGAAQLALLCLLLVMAILAAEYALRRSGTYASSARQSAPLAPARLCGWRAAIAVTACLAPVLAGFVLPAGFLMVEAARALGRSGLSPEIPRALLNSLALSLAAGVIVAVLGVLVALAARLLPYRLAALAPRIGTLGYAIPGTVLVIALLPLLSLADGALDGIGLPLVLSGSMAAILIAYLIRFTGMGIAQAEAGLARLSPNIDQAARTLGGSPNRLAFGVLAPNILRAVLLGGLLVLVDAMKELPATLLLRPLNVETLATSLYAHASSGSFESGAMEALLLLVIGLVPTLLLARFR